MGDLGCHGPCQQLSQEQDQGGGHGRVECVCVLGGGVHSREEPKYERIIWRGKKKNILRTVGERERNPAGGD